MPFSLQFSSCLRLQELVVKNPTTDYIPMTRRINGSVIVLVSEIDLSVTLKKLGETIQTTNWQFESFATEVCFGSYKELHAESNL